MNKENLKPALTPKEVIEYRKLFAKKYRMNFNIMMYRNGLYDDILERDEELSRREGIDATKEISRILLDELRKAKQTKNDVTHNTEIQFDEQSDLQFEMPEWEQELMKAQLTSNEEVESPIKDEPTVEENELVDDYSDDVTIGDAFDGVVDEKESVVDEPSSDVSDEESKEESPVEKEEVVKEEEVKPVAKKRGRPKKEK